MGDVAFAKELSETASRDLGVLEEIWRSIGLEPADCAERRGEVLAHVKKVLTNIVLQEREQKAALEESVRADRRALQDLSMELDLPYQPPASSHTLLQQSEELEAAVRTLLEEKERRLERLVDLESKMEELRHSLVIQESRASMAAADISLQRIEKLSRRVEEYERERTDRLQTVQECMSVICHTWKELGMHPDSDVARSVAQGPAAFVLSPANIMALQRLKAETDQQRAQRVKDVAAVGEQLRSLWAKLEVPEAEQERILRTHQGIHARSLQALQGELQKMVRLRDANLERFVQATKKELAQWWDRCYVGEAERGEYEHTLAALPLSEQLQSAEEEVGRWRAHHTRCEAIFKLLARRQEIFDQLDEFDRTISAADRLTNRGGVLLREERFRKAAAKEIPKLEKDMMEEIADFEESSQTHFLVHGERLRDALLKKAEERAASATHHPHSGSVRRPDTSASSACSSVQPAAAAIRAEDARTPKRKASQKAPESRTPKTRAPPSTPASRIPLAASESAKPKTPSVKRPALADTNAKVEPFSHKELQARPLLAHQPQPVVASLHGSFVDFVGEASGKPRSSNLQ